MVIIREYLVSEFLFIKGSATNNRLVKTILDRVRLALLYCNFYRPVVQYPFMSKLIP